MIALVQRVSSASVTVDGRETGSIGAGMLILLGVHNDDTEAELDWLVKKCAQLRIFRDDEGRMNRSIEDVGGDALVVSQFTLYANTEKGNRPSYVHSAGPEKAEPLYELFIQRLSARLGRTVPSGIFGAMMDVELVNDGPVTIWLERTPA
jgi:D-tyrosyl-tRNA(Tyr) deacylase